MVQAELNRYAENTQGSRASPPSSALIAVEDEGDRLTEAEIVSTTMVLLEAGHEATVNALCNGVRALMKHRDQWQRLLSHDNSGNDTVSGGMGNDTVNGGDGVRLLLAGDVRC